MRDRIVIIGRRRAGKTIYLARLYEALWNGCTLADGRIIAKADERPGARRSRLSCRALSGAADAAFMGIIADLKAGKWPAATSGSTYAELELTHDGREHVLTTLDYPGEVFRKAFMLDSEDQDAVDLRHAIDRAKAAIFLIDPAVVAGGGEEAREDSFGMTQAAVRIRRSADGANLPIAIVFTKCDVNDTFLKEAGGTLAFARKHFGQLFKGVQRTSVFPCTAVQVRQNALGKPVPVISRPPINVVEPLHYCLEQISMADVVQEEMDRRTKLEREIARQQQAAERAKGDALRVWTIFWIAVVALALVAVVGALIYVGR